MRSAEARRSTSLAGVAAVIALCVGMAACSSTGEPMLDLNATALAGDIAPLAEAQGPQPAPAQIAVSGEAGMALPPKVKATPDARPETETVAEQQKPAAEPAVPPASVAEARPEARQSAASTPPAGEQPKQFLENGGQILTAGQMPAAPLPAKKKGFLNSFFGAREAAAAPGPTAQLKADAAGAREKPAEKARPLVIVSATPGQQKPLSMASLGRTAGGGDALPGVRSYESLFEIKRKSGTDDTSDIDIHEDEGGAPVRVASAAGLARLAPNGLLRQREDVDVSCLKPGLVSMLRQVEARFGKKVVVTSGYRSPTHNRRVNGAQKSQHMYCAAADVQVPGVSKWELARFARSLQGRGGVGTYCHTESVHIDVGPERDWNWRCRRRG